MEHGAKGFRLVYLRAGHWTVAVGILKRLLSVIRERRPHLAVCLAVVGVRIGMVAYALVVHGIFGCADIVVVFMIKYRRCVDSVTYITFSQRRSIGEGDEY